MVREMSVGWFVLGHGRSFLTATRELSSFDAVSQMKALCGLGGWAPTWGQHWCLTELHWSQGSLAPKEVVLSPLDWIFAILSHWRLVGVSSFKEILTWPRAEGLCQNRGWRRRKRNAFKHVWGELGVAGFQGCAGCGRGTQDCPVT